MPSLKVRPWVGTTIPETAMFIAIIFIKSESFALCITMLKHALPMQRIIFLIFFSLMSPIGIGVGMMINELTYGDHGTLLAATFDAFAAGTFIYIRLCIIFDFINIEETQGMLEFGCLVLGWSRWR